MFQHLKIIYTHTHTHKMSNKIGKVNVRNVRQLNTDLPAGWVEMIDPRFVN